MSMIHAGFLSSSERLELEACVRRQREDHGIARRANAILLLDDGKSCQEISEFLYLDDDTIRRWYKTYREDGWDALALNGWKGGHSQMTQAQESALCAWLDERFCRSTVEIRAHISAKLDLEYSHSGCIKLLARLGFEYRKPKPLPRVASAEKQTAFIALYEKLMRELPADEAVYFADAVHPEYQSKPAFGWVKAGSNPAVLSTPGRGRSKHSWRCEPRNLRYTLCRTNDSGWGQRRAAARRDREAQPRQTRYSCDLGQCRLPQRAGCQGFSGKNNLPYPPDPAAAILPTSQSD